MPMTAQLEQRPARTDGYRHLLPGQSVGVQIRGYARIHQVALHLLIEVAAIRMIQRGRILIHDR
jgi:hypothetical protein